MTKPVEWETPKWMEDCITYFWDTHKQFPSTMDFLMWQEADASCRLERE